MTTSIGYCADVSGSTLTPPLPREQIRDVLIECARRSGLRASWVEAIVTRGFAPRGVRDPRQYKAQFQRYAVPQVWISEPAQQTVGTDLRLGLMFGSNNG